MYRYLYVIYIYIYIYTYCLRGPRALGACGLGLVACPTDLDSLHRPMDHGPSGSERRDSSGERMHPAGTDTHSLSLSSRGSGSPR